MTPYTFRRTDSWKGESSNPKGSESTRRSLNFRDNKIYLSKMLSDQMGIVAGSHLAFTYDEDKPQNIYIRTADDPDDTHDIQSKVSYAKKSKGSLRCCNIAVVRHVLHHVGADRACTCYVSPSPILINGKQHYQILVGCPIMVN
ncbi:MAG: hypothetical protein IJ640_00175 [Prevotella sp.]|nr:hypothetical protein [Prevotella sp.]